MGKEWNGNNNSVAAQIGLGTTWHPEERAADDFYTTDPESLRTFASHFKLDKIIWEPACGTGNLSKVLEELCEKVYSSDLRNRGYGESGINFLDCERVPDGVTSIVTNPPYKLANDFIEHAMEILPEGGTYIALMNLSYLAGKERYARIYANRWLEAIYVHSGRINCWKNDVKHSSNSPVNYAWYVFRKPANRQGGVLPAPHIRWIE